MGETVLLLIVISKALVEVAALSLLAQGLLRILAGSLYPQNFAYRLFHVIAGPAVAFARRMSPRFIGPRYLELVAFLLLFWIWLALIYAKASVCNAWQLVCFTGR